MAENTAISWADDTWNPWEGCQKVSPACDGCYAETRNLRYAPKGSTEAPNWGPGAPRRRTAEANWKKPLKWEREQAALVDAYRKARLIYDGLPKTGMLREPTPPPPRFVFCASLADVFDNAVPTEWRRDLFELIRATPHLTWLLLTKRPGNIAKLWEQIQYGRSPADQTLIVKSVWPRNAAIGCTVVTQEEADRDIPKLLAAKGVLKPAFAFVSMEPLLEAVDVSPWLTIARTRHDRDCAYVASEGPAPCTCSAMERLDWVITGGETDQGQHKARPSNPDWFRSLRDQCAAAGVAYHHKQNGEWRDYRSLGANGWNFTREIDGKRMGRLVRGDFEGEGEPMFGGREFETLYPWPETNANPCMVKAGKKAPGHDLLDGVLHDARPQP